MGRPSSFTQEIAETICSKLAAGEPLVKICRNEDMPHVATVYRWMVDNESFRDMYARAREDQADTLADQIIEIADDGLNDTYETDKGEQTNQDVIARSRLRVDARKWVAAKLKPKKYGERVEAEVRGLIATKEVSDMELAMFFGPVVGRAVAAKRGGQ